MAPPLNQKLQGKVAVVTGGASGIGEAAVRLFAAYGARAVVIVDIQDDKGHAVADSIGSDRCSYFQCDVTDEEKVRALMDWTAETYGGLDIVFSNAGTISPPNQSILELDLAVYDRVMRINARGMAVCVKQAARKMVELGTRGSIVCTASTAATISSPTNVDYTMSKHALIGLMNSSFPTLGEHGIRINCVSPGVTATPLAINVWAGNAEELAKMSEPLMCLKGAALKAENVAEVAAFLGSDESAFITGQNLVVDGGMSIHAVIQTMTRAAAAAAASQL
ncbi:(+)-cis,cis-nepetalactol synthase NEPS3-like [Andrographis paniculata]|uniref:(+)-cis,cis-nepetalactol synthase NEPS3-like n=1 Tax=Andrographis paniculata TaxID=175694 RepID=UPI0021E88B32|nr:(+)-cis,cis-nepetalactol synthase NEPS3-like [Andrographis paniculata]